MENSSFNNDIAHFQSIWDDYLLKSKSSQMVTPKATQENSPYDSYSMSGIDDIFGAVDVEKPLDMCDMLLVSENISKFINNKQLNENVDTKKIKDRTEKLANSSNPIYPYGLNADQDVIVTPNFTDGSALRDLSDLKIRLEAIERQLHASQIYNDSGKENSFFKQVDSIKKQIEKLNNEIGTSDKE